MEATNLHIKYAGCFEGRPVSKIGLDIFVIAIYLHINYAGCRRAERVKVSVGYFFFPSS